MLLKTHTQGNLFQTLQSIYSTSFLLFSSVWHFCGTHDADKLEALNKRIPYLFDYKPSDFYGHIIINIILLSSINKVYVMLCCIVTFIYKIAKIVHAL